MMTTDDFRKEYFAIHMMLFALEYISDSGLEHHDYKADGIRYEMKKSLRRQNEFLYDRAIRPYTYPETAGLWKIMDEFKALQEQSLNLMRKYRDQGIRTVEREIAVYEELKRMVN